MKEPPEKRPPRLLKAARGVEFDGSPATIEDQNSKASTESRRCSGCSCVVSNHNLGGHSGSALSGMLWCDACTSAQAEFRLLREKSERRAAIAAAQVEVRKALEAAVAAKIAEFDHCDQLLVRSLVAFRQFRAAPHYVERQHKLLLLIRECFRDVDFIVRDWYWGCKS